MAAFHRQQKGVQKLEREEREEQQRRGRVRLFLSITQTKNPKPPPLSPSEPLSTSRDSWFHLSSDQSKHTGTYFCCSAACWWDTFCSTLLSSPLLPIKTFLCTFHLLLSHSPIFFSATVSGWNLKALIQLCCFFFRSPPLPSSNFFIRALLFLQNYKDDLFGAFLLNDS